MIGDIIAEDATTLPEIHRKSVALFKLYKGETLDDETAISINLILGDLINSTYNLSFYFNEGFSIVFIFR